LSKKTVSAIISSKNDYLIVVKRNQKILDRQIELHTSNLEPIRCFQQTEKTRNRLINRTIEVFTAPSSLDSRWIGVNCVMKIFRSGTRGKHDYESDSATYYISSLSPTSSLIPLGIRRHWTIENRLHWVKDVVTKEDISPTLQGKASTNISLIKSWVINLLRVHGFDSITEALDHMSNNLPLLLSFCH
jgi:predicted transposase YbfD/YdcC